MFDSLPIKCTRLALPLVVMALSACGSNGYSLPETQAPVGLPNAAAPSAPAGTGTPATPAAPAGSTVAPGSPAPAAPAAPPTAACSGFTWKNGASAFFTKTCYSCHSSPSSTFDASSQMSVATNVTAIVRDIQTGTMPLGGAGPVPAATVAQLQAWVACQMP
jgi:hypothetical protein